MQLTDYLPLVPSAVVVVAKAENLEALATVHQALQAKMADFLLIGDAAKIRRMAAENGFDIAGAKIVDQPDEAAACQMAADAAASGQAQVVMKGDAQTTTFTRALLDKTRGLISQGNLISHVSIFAIPGYHKPLLLTDAAINIEPDLERKKVILRNAVDIAHRLGIAVPKVACLAPGEKLNEKVPSTVHGSKLVLLQQTEQAFGQAIVEGPMAFDAAMSRKAADMKGIKGEVPGDCDILLCHCLDTANAIYKALALFAKAEHAGILAGLTVPVALTSRSDNAETRLVSLRFALTVSGNL
jgi:phosphate butyryltransferase